MNKNLRKLTEGAILLGIYGAILVLNRYVLVNMIDTLILIVAAVILIINIMRNGNTYTSGMVIGVIFLSFVFGSDNAYIITGTPLGIIEGLILGNGYKNNKNRSTTLFISMAIAAVYELLSILLLMPLFGLNIADDLSFLQETLGGLTNAYENAGINVNTLNIFTPSYLKLLVMVSYLITGVVETFIIYAVSNLILRRMKISIPATASITDINIHPLVGYVCMAFTIAFRFISDKPEMNETLFNLISMGAVISMMLLLFVGYVFCLRYGIIVLRKRVGFYVILLTFLLLPISIIVLLIFGFMYIAGPLKQYLYKKQTDLQKWKI